MNTIYNIFQNHVQKGVKIVSFLFIGILLIAVVGCHEIRPTDENSFTNSQRINLLTLDPTSTILQPSTDPTTRPNPSSTPTPEFVLSTQTDQARQGWTKYTNDKYHFSVLFPEYWEVSEALTPSLESNFLILSPKSDPDVQLILGFKWADEEIRIERTGIPAGEVISEGTLEILGQEITRDVLLYEEKTKAVLYNNGMGIEENGLIFTINLGVDSSDIGYEAVDISSNYQEAVDEIIATLVVMP